MQNTKSLILPLLLLALVPSIASAQEVETFHVFPMVIAGDLADESERETAFIATATNVDGHPTTCVVEIIGMPQTSVDNAGVLSLPSQGSIAIVGLDSARVPPDVGYATMTCDHVATGMAVQILDPGGATPADGLATILPAVRSSVASIPLAMDDEFGSTVVVAIVNDDSVNADFDVTVFDISDVVVGTARVYIPAKNQLVEDIAMLIPELLPVPADDFLGSIRISSVAVDDRDPPSNVPTPRLPATATRFYALGMFMEGTVRTAFPATQLEP